jgi:hypothetical protein
MAYCASLIQRDFRDSVSAIKQIPVSIPSGGQVPLSSLASIEYSSGPPEVRSENGQLPGACKVKQASSPNGLASLAMRIVDQNHRLLGDGPKGTARPLVKPHTRGKILTLRLITCSENR